MRAAGFVLVGGRSSRMGQDKAFLPLNSRSLVENVAGRVAAAAGNIALVGAPERYRHLGLDCLADLRPGLGPLAGIEAALESRRGEFNLIVACDMPDLQTNLLGRLLREAEASGAECVATRDASGAVHPLCAVYRSSCLAAVRRALDLSCLRLRDMVRDLRTVILDAGEIVSNVNTPQEWAALQQQANGN